MFAGVTVLAGPAGSGKTERLLAAYRQVLAAGPPGAALWLSPTARSSTAVRQHLLCADLSGCFSPNCLTFSQFSSRVLAASGQESIRLTPLMKRALLGELIKQQSAGGRLTYFSPIAQTPGLVDLVDQFITELKRLEIWPDDFARACSARGMTDKDRELLELYECYQQRLVDHQLFDAEGCYWAARSLLQSGQRRPFENVQFVVVDGFTDFTRTQHEMLQCLAEQARALIVALPLESPDGDLPARLDLFAKTRRTLDELGGYHSGLHVEYLPRSDRGPWPLRNHIESNLFRSPRDQQPAAENSGLEIIGAAGQLAEIEQVGARIKRLLVHRDVAADGKEYQVRPRDIIVVFRSLSEIGPTVREVFADMGIPTALELRPPLASISPLSALLSLLELDLHDWPFRELLAVLGHNCLLPSCYAAADMGKAHTAAVAAAEHVVRALQLPSGRDQLIEQVERWAEKPPRHDDKGNLIVDRREMRRPHAAAALPLLRWLADNLQSMPKRATARQWVDQLRMLVAATGLLTPSAANMPSQPGLAEAESAALEQFFQAFASLEDLSISLGQEPPQLTRRELAEYAAEILRRESLPAQNDDVGRVRVLSAVSARNLSAPFVFLCSLVEKSFPAPLGDGHMYSEAEIKRLIDAKLPLSSRLERSQDEMLLFYEIVTRATRRLWLSYPALDDKAQPLSPSPYLDELERACGRLPSERSVALHLSPVPDPAATCSPRDLRVAAAHEALERRPALLAGFCASNLQAGEGLLWGIQAVDGRRNRQAFGAFEGWLDSPAIHTLLAERFGPQRVWSPSQLEQYANCPFKFFAERILHLEPLDDLTLATDYAERGKLLHAALARIHRQINERLAARSSVCASDEQEFAADVMEVLQAIADAEGKLPAVDAALRQVDRALVGQWLEAYRSQHAKYDQGAGQCDEPIRPAYFEAAFGPQYVEADDPESPDPDSVASDSLSSAKPYQFQYDGETIQLGGRIDRIDVGRVAGKVVFNVLDYKSGSPRSHNKSAIDQGLALQLPLYALVVEKLLLSAQEALPWQAGYWFVKDKGFQAEVTCHESVPGGIAPAATWLAQREKLFSRVVSLVRSIRGGQFPVFSFDDECTSRCEFRTVCRVGQARATDKSWQALEVKSP